jgi:hypothetical protein
LQHPNILPLHEAGEPDSAREGALIALAAAFFPVNAVLRTDVMTVLREQ